MRGCQEMKALAVVTSSDEIKDQSAFDYVARTIVDYLSDETLTIDGARVEAKDIAILLRSQTEISAMQKQLQRYGVQSRVVSKERIYDSDDAHEVEAILRAALNPRDLKAVKTALATRIIGCDAMTVYLDLVMLVNFLVDLLLAVSCFLYIYLPLGIHDESRAYAHQDKSNSFHINLILV